MRGTTLPQIKGTRPLLRRQPGDTREAYCEPRYHPPAPLCAPGGCGKKLTDEEAKLPPIIIKGSGYRYEAGRCLACRRMGR